MLSAKVKVIKASIPVESTLDPNLMILSYAQFYRKRHFLAIKHLSSCSIEHILKKAAKQSPDAVIDSSRVKNAIIKVSKPRRVCMHQARSFFLCFCCHESPSVYYLGSKTGIPVSPRILSEAELKTKLTEYADCYNTERLHEYLFQLRVLLVGRILYRKMFYMFSDTYKEICIFFICYISYIKGFI